MVGDRLLLKETCLAYAVQEETLSLPVRFVGERPRGLPGDLSLSFSGDLSRGAGLFAWVWLAAQGQLEPAAHLPVFFHFRQSPVRA